jgi:plastocyanin
LNVFSRGFRATLALLLLALAGCSSGGGGSSSPPPPPPAKASLTVVNSTSLDVTEVYIAIGASSTWGVNQLSIPIAPGASRTISAITAGIYDVRAVASDGSSVERYGVQLTEGGAFTWTLVSSSGALKVVNAYSAPITELYVAASSSGSWGTNQLEAAIASGDTFTLTSIPAGTYDLRAVAADGGYVETYAVTIAAGETVTWTLTTATLPTGSVVVVNSYAFPIDELYVTPSSDTTWGPNQLTSPIPPGGSRTITGVPAGLIDLRAVASDGAYAESYDVPLGAGETFTWTLSAVTQPTGSVRVVNNYSYPITQLYVTLSTSSTWGPNQLSAPIPAGGSYTVTGVPVGLIDVRAVASDGAYAEDYDLLLGAGETITWTLTATASVTVLNSSYVPVPELYIALSSSPYWGPNRLSSPILAGGSYTVTGLPSDTYDFLAAESSGYWLRPSVYLAPGSTFTWQLLP